MGLKQQIDSDIKSAMLAKQKEELLALRAIKSMILLAETEKGKTGELDKEAENKLLMKAAKQRKESADIFKKENREDLYRKEMLEYEIISRYLPSQMTRQEVLDEVKKIIQQVGAGGLQDLGKVMGTATKALSGRADGKMVAEIAKQLLSA